jgi:Ca2+-binding EF-hand superfamily protein
MVFKIREWFKREKFSVEEAFRVIDKHYAGEIREADLLDFMKNTIKIKEEELTQGRIDRLFKLMDQYKRGRVVLIDFKRFLIEDFDIGMN